MRQIKLIALGYLLTLLIATPLVLGQTQADAPAGSPRFVTLDIHIDPRGEPLAAYQFELTEADGRMTVVGLENGEHPAFADPPHYDRAAIDAGHADRVIAAAYSLRPASQLPTGRTRVCTVHVQITGSAAPQFQLTLVAAGDAEARPIDATIESR